MGVDWLDIRFRIERRFGIRLDPQDFYAPASHPHSEVTAGELHATVCAKLRDAGRGIPRSSWNGVRLELGRALGVSPLSIRPEYGLVRDLGMG